jgi:uncharacterized membrane protein (UPF0127 family)
MIVHLLKTAQEQYQGVRGRDGVSPGEFFVFPGLSNGTQFTMRGVPFSIDIGFWDRKGNLLEVITMEGETGGATAPTNSYLAIESAPGFLSGLSSVAVKSIISSLR